MFGATVSGRQKRRRKDGCRREYSDPTRIRFTNFDRKRKNKRRVRKIERQAADDRQKPMKNNRRAREISREDFDSVFMRESVLENNRAGKTFYLLSESPFSRCLGLQLRFFSLSCPAVSRAY
jgi:hypothetical protein